MTQPTTAGDCANCGWELVWHKHPNGGAGLRHYLTGALMCRKIGYQSAAIRR